MLIDFNIAFKLVTLTYWLLEFHQFAVIPGSCIFWKELIVCLIDLEHFPVLLLVTISNYAELLKMFLFP